MVNCIGKFTENEREIAALVRERLAQAGDGERLAGRAATQYVGGLVGTGQHAIGDLRHVTEVRYMGVVMGEHRAREGLNLGEPRRFPPERAERDGRGLNAAAYGAEFHSSEPRAPRSSISLTSAQTMLAISPTVSPFGARGDDKIAHST